MNKNKFRVLGFDSFSHEEFHVGYYDTAAEAIKVANEKGGVMTLMYVYDPTGRLFHQAGSW